MGIVIHLKRELARRGIKQGELADTIGLSQVNLSRLSTNSVKAIRFKTLEAICEALDCSVEDILTYETDVHRDARSD